MNLQNYNENENLNKLIEDKNIEIKNLKEKLSSIEKSCSNKLIEMKKKVDLAEKLSQESELESTQISSNYEKEKVLMKQKIIFLEKTIKENESNNNKSYAKNSKSYSTLSTEDATSMKQRKEKLERDDYKILINQKEALIKQQQNEIDSLKLKCNELFDKINFGNRQQNLYNKTTTNDMYTKNKKIIIHTKPKIYY